MTRFFISLLVILFASAAHSMTIDEAVEYALKNNPELMSLRLEDGAAKGQLEKARLLLINNPIIEGEVSRKEKPDEEGSGGYKNYGFKLSHEFEIAGQRGIRIDAAEKELLRIGYEIKDKERVIAYDVKDAFVKALASKKKAGLKIEEVKLKEELLDAAKIKFQAGEVSGIEVNIAELGLNKARVELLSAEKEYRESLLFLQGIIGAKPFLDFNVEGELSPDISLQINKEEFKTFALMQRHDLKASSIDVKRSQSALELAEKGAVPNLTISGFYDRDEERNAFGLAFSIPIPIFDRRQAEKSEARVKREQARIKLAAIEKIIEREIEEAYNSLTTSVDELKIFKKDILDKALENLELLTIAFKEGKISFFDVRLAQKDAIEMQFTYLEAQIKTQLAINAMERAIGGGLK